MLREGNRLHGRDRTAESGWREEQAPSVDPARFIVHQIHSRACLDLRARHRAALEGNQARRPLDDNTDRSLESVEPGGNCFTVSAHSSDNLAVSGGVPVSAGAEYQANVTGLICAHILAGSELGWIETSDDTPVAV